MKNRRAIGVLFIFVLSLLSCGLKRETRLSPEEEGLYDALQLVMTGAERDIFKKLKDEKAREEYMKEFWEKRDPDLSTEENEFREEFEGRLSYANLHFKSEGMPGWKTDRGRIYIYLGKPDQIYEHPYLNYPSLKGRIVWVYYRYRLGIEFLDRTGTNRYDMQHDPYYSFRLMNAINRAKFGFIYNQEPLLEKKADEFDMDFDRDSKEIVVKIPNSALLYKEESGYFLVNLRFDFYIYSDSGEKKEKFSRTKSFKEPKEKVIDMEEVVFSFPYSFEPGSYYIDVKVSDAGGMGQFRKIMTVKIK